MSDEMKWNNEVKWGDEGKWVIESWEKSNSDHDDDEAYIPAQGWELYLEVHH